MATTETYRISRFFFKGRTRVLKRGCTMEEVLQHVSDPETSSQTAKSPRAKARTAKYGLWFDGYEKE